MNEEVKVKVINEAKRIEEDSLFSAKGHFCDAQFWTNFHLWIGIPTVAIAAIAGGLAFSSATVFAGILSIIVAASTAVITFVNPNEKASAHRNAGVDYNSLRNDTRIFYDVEALQLTDDKELLNKLEQLNRRRAKLGEESPQISKGAYLKAKKGIEVDGEAAYRVDSCRGKRK